MPVVVVSGAPCSGKSTFCRERCRPGDLIIDADAMAEAMGLGQHAGCTRNDVAMQAVLAARETARQFALRFMTRTTATCWLIDTKPTPQRAKEYAMAGAQRIVLDPGEAECIRRAQHDGRRAETLNRIRAYYGSGR